MTKTTDRNKTVFNYKDRKIIEKKLQIDCSNLKISYL